MICTVCKTGITIDQFYHHCFFCEGYVCENCVSIDQDSEYYFEELYTCNDCVKFIKLFRNVERVVVQNGTELLYEIRKLMRGLVNGKFDQGNGQSSG